MIKTVCATALLATVSVTAASAQGRFVAFGDSLSDNGNLAIIAPGTQPPPPYFGGRFSNGPTFVEILSGGSMNGIGPVDNTKSTNFAIGGARTDNAPNTNGPIPGTGAQILTYQALGGRFSSTDTVTLWGGANNLFQGIPVAAANPATATTTMTTVAGSAANDIGNQVRQLAAAGAGRIVVLNLPYFGALPQFTVNAPTANALASFSSSTFDSALNTAVGAAAAANRNTNVVQVDAQALFAAVIANPTAFGFSNVTTKCLASIACATGTAAVQNQYLFWDDVHPTAAGHRLLAQVVNTYLISGDRSAATAIISEIGLEQRRSTAQRSLERLENANPKLGKTEYQISAVGDFARLSASGLKPSYDWGTGGLQLTGVHRFTESWTGGLSLSASTGSASTGISAGNKLTFDPTVFGIDAIARWSTGIYHVSGGLGFGVAQYRNFERTLYIGNLVNKGDATGTLVSALVEGGAAYQFNAFGVLPTARFGYLWSNTGSFNETGTLAPLSYSSRAIGTFTAGAEVKLTATLMQTAANTLGAYALIGYEGYFGQNNDAVKAQLIANTALPTSVTVKNVRSPGIQVGGGLFGNVGKFQLGADYRASIDDNGQARHRLSATLKTSF